MADRTLYSRIQLRNDTAQNWVTNNTKLLKGEMGIEIETRKFKIGDGINNWNGLKYANSGSSNFIDISNGITEDHIESVTNNPNLPVKIGNKVYSPTYLSSGENAYFHISDVNDNSNEARQITFIQITWETGTTQEKVSQIETYKIPKIEVSQDNGYIKVNNENIKVYEFPTALKEELTNKIEGVKLGGTLLEVDAEKNANIPVETNVNTSANPVSSNAVNTAITNVNTNISNNYIPNSAKGTANGVATLDNDSKINASQLPDYLLGQVLYGGSINASHTATLSAKAKTRLGVTSPTISLVNSAENVNEGTTTNYGWVVNEGIYYLASENISFANIAFSTGDWLISNGTSWQKIDNTDAVTSVAGRTGAITLSIGDIVGLGTEIDGLSENKVDKEEGKGLSTNDFTDDLKTKLMNLNPAGEANVQSDWNETSTSSDAYIKNKPTKLSQFTNDLNLPNDNTTYTFEGGTNSFKVTPSGGTTQTVTVTPSIANATTSSNGLMSSSDKKKLNEIEEGANKTVVDAEMSETSTNPLQNKEITRVVNAIEEVINQNAKDIVTINDNLKKKISDTDVLILDCGNASDEFDTSE